MSAATKDVLLTDLLTLLDELIASRAVESRECALQGLGEAIVRLVSTADRLDADLAEAGLAFMRRHEEACRPRLIYSRPTASC